MSKPKKPDDITVDPVTTDTDELFPISAQRLREEEAARLRNKTMVDAYIAAFHNPQLFQTVAGKGIYLGPWVPLGWDHDKPPVYDLYAAPSDIVRGDNNWRLATFNGISKIMKGQSEWRGHKIATFKTDHDLADAIEQNEYKGEWFIPTAHILTRLRTHQNEKDLKSTFSTATQIGRAKPNFYWACNEQMGRHYFIDFAAKDKETDRSDWALPGFFRMATRLVRAEPWTPDRFQVPRASDTSKPAAPKANP